VCVIDTGVDISHPTFGRGCPEGPNCRIAFGFDVESQGDDPVSSSLEGRARNFSWMKVQVRNTLCQQQSRGERRGAGFMLHHTTPASSCCSMSTAYTPRSASFWLLFRHHASVHWQLPACPSRTSRHAEQCRSSCAARQPDSDTPPRCMLKGSRCWHHTALPSPSAELQVLTITPCICLLAGHADPFRLGECRGPWDPRVRHCTGGLPSQAQGCRWQPTALSEGGGIRC
jgi:hypothetical protein